MSTTTTTAYTINKKDFGSSIHKNETVLQNIILDNGKNNLCTDISNINYTEGYNRLDNIKPLTSAFCDNLVLFKILDYDNECTGTMGGRDLRVKQEYTGIYNRTIRANVSNFISKEDCMVQCKIPFPLNADTIQGSGVREVLGKKYLEVLGDRIEKMVVLPFKVSLAEVPLDNLLENIKEFLNKLSEQNYFLADFDITQDYTGIFNKEECIDYLQEEHDFYVMGRSNNNVEKGLANCIILDNNNTVGKDCLTWLYKNTRAKIYNKFVCQISSPGVTKHIGHHIIEHTLPNKARLNNTLTSKDAKECGVTRFETTIYNYGNFYTNKEFDPLKDCKEILQESLNYFKECNLFYKVPIEDMWKKLVSSVKSTLTLHYNNLIVHVYWVNMLTRKITGIVINTDKYNYDKEKQDKMCNFALNACSFNLTPAHLIQIEDGEDETLYIKHSCYFKEGSTLFTKQDSLFSVLKLDVKDYGLCSTTNCIPCTNQKRINIDSKLNIYEMVPLEEFNPVILISRKDKHDLEKNAEDILKRQVFLKEAINRYTISIAKKNEITKHVKEITKMFNDKWESMQNEDIFKEGDICNVNAIMVLENETFPRVGALVFNKNTGTQNVCLIKGYAKENLKQLVNKTNKKSLLPIYSKKGTGYMLPNMEELSSFVVGEISTFNGNIYRRLEKCTNIFIENISEENKENLDKYKDRISNEIQHLDIPKNSKFSSFNSINNLQPGKYIITKLGTIEFRNKERNIFTLEGHSNIYTDNYWFAEELDKNSKLLKLEMQVEDKYKTTPTKSKHRLVFIKPAVLENDNNNNTIDNTEEEDTSNKDIFDNIKRAKQIDTLDNNSVYIIDKIILKEYRNKERYLFTLEEKPGDVYVDNYWFLKAISPITLTGNSKLKIEFGVLKTTPQKIKQRMVTQLDLI